MNNWRKIDHLFIWKVNEIMWTYWRTALQSVIGNNFKQHVQIKFKVNNSLCSSSTWERERERESERVSEWVRERERERANSKNSSDRIGTALFNLIDQKVSLIKLIVTFLFSFLNRNINRYWINGQIKHSSNDCLTFLLNKSIVFHLTGKVQQRISQTFQDNLLSLLLYSREKTNEFRFEY